jgi:hypothetical protein
MSFGIALGGWPIYLRSFLLSHHTVGANPLRRARLYFCALSQRDELCLSVIATLPQEIPILIPKPWLT